jgi:thioredoxin reductase (NADPH)
VVVVGAGNSAGQAVMHLAEAGATVTMLVRGDALGSSMSKYLVDRIHAHDRVDVRFQTQVAEVAEVDGHLGSVITRRADGASEKLTARALFLCLGGVPRTAWAPERGVQVDDGGFIVTGTDLLTEAGRRPNGWALSRDPLTLETSVPGLIAAGDVRRGAAKRVGAAVGDGAMAVALAHQRLAELRDG